MCLELTGLVSCLRDILSEWEGYLNNPLGSEAHSYHARTVSTVYQPGRPKFDITKQQLEYLRSLGFTWVQIAKLVGVSRMTIFRRRQEFEMAESFNMSITDHELEIVVRQIKQDFPYVGQTMIWGRVRAMGYHVTRERIRETVRSVDPINTALRWREASIRRTYSVPDLTVSGT